MRKALSDEYAFLTLWPIFFCFFVRVCLCAGAPVRAANQGAGSGEADCGQSAGKMQTRGRVARRW